MHVVSVIFSVLFFVSTTLCEKPFTIMLDPFGDAANSGRMIEDTLERGITLQCAEELRDTLYKKYNGIRVVITRTPGETIPELQNASFANRLDVDIYISLLFYQEYQTKPHIGIYYYVVNPSIDTHHQDNLSIIYPYSQAYLPNLMFTQTFAKHVGSIFKNKKQQHYFTLLGVYGLPLQPLLGIQPPAILIEAGLLKIDDWQKLIEPLVASLEGIIA